MDTPLMVGASMAALGVGVMVIGAMTRSTGSNAAEYLRSLDGEPVGVRGHDDFDAHLTLPLSQRTIGPLLSRLVAAVSSVTPTDHRARIRTQLARAGLDLRRSPEEVIAAQVVGSLIGFSSGMLLAVSGTLTSLLSLVATVVLTGAGATAPMAWLSRRASQRIHAIRADLPDTLDLLAISVEAGVGLEGALEVVTKRFSSPLADELARMLQEMGLGLSRRDALSNLKLRSNVPELSSFTQALIQAEILGMPLGRVLKNQATEMRSKRRQWARERAAKLPVKILFPLIFCIFPAVLVVVLGPAVSKIGQAL